MDEFIGIIKIFAGNFAPKGWFMCQGQLLPIAQNTALFSILGTTYGGNGTTTFALPDLRGRSPIGFGQGPGLSNYSLGQVSGLESVTLNVSNLPAHNHAVTGSVQLPVNTDGSSLAEPSGAYLGVSSSNIYSISPSSGEVAGALNVNLSTAAAGNGVPVSTIQPVLAVNYIICSQGIYPSRD